MNVWVTGMAWSTALGDGLAGVWRRLLDGHDGFEALPSEHPLRNPLAATVADPPAGMKPSARQRILAEGTLSRALADAGGPADAYPVLGTSFGALLDDEDGDLWQWAADVAAAVGLRRPPVAVSTACSSGSDAIAVGAAAIRSGAADVSVCGAADVVTPAKRLAHTALRTMSPTRLRAFDRRADGTLLGEGAGFVVLEREEAARARGAVPYAVLAGTGAANDGAGMTAPDPGGTGAELAARRCLASCGLTVEDVAVVNAHGSGTPANDSAESAALARLFGGCERPPVVFATKGALGHTLGATGALEAVAVVLALLDGRAPPIPGLDEVIEGFPLPVATGSASRLRPGAGLSLTLGFGGFITCLAFTPGQRHAH
ncbi:3-oxoacyl-[acyl-carrier-protein] synthase II [Nonomuraea solani]|uniref:3-oxoacyl-[acyl-carrier-protein] synthase II n=1 Tax=Nonomuraea solani TaxID=1144553 RepID=A0A1H6F1W5_9ACTN|nr:beta-ketoacyl-[acyl-carrier-protein] synthase family protein [Nonomuraea solani]SEH02924.1 3-oxoacyl-[acyl-carrier-protein] synthase II [Nonomuraea solani]